MLEFRVLKDVLADFVILARKLSLAFGHQSIGQLVEIVNNHGYPRVLGVIFPVHEACWHFFHEGQKLLTAKTPEVEEQFDVRS